MFTTLLAALALVNLPVDPGAGESRLTTLNIRSVGEGAVLSWSDAEEVLKGSLSVSQPRAGQAVTFSVQLLTYDGVRFDGPVTLSMRPLSGYGQGSSVTVAPGEEAYTATFTPEEPGEYRLEAAWRSTAYKVVRGRFEVATPPMPRWLVLTLSTGLVAIVVAFTTWLVRRNG